MIFFDFLFYSVYKFYASHKEKGAASTSAGIIGGFQTMNVLTIIMFCQFLFRQKTYIGKLWAVVLFLVFQITTYYHYIYKDSHSVDVIKRKWLDKTEPSRKQMNNLLLLYGVISIIVFLDLLFFWPVNKALH